MYEGSSVKRGRHRHTRNIGKSCTVPCAFLNGPQHANVMPMHIQAAYVFSWRASPLRGSSSQQSLCPASKAVREFEEEVYMDSR